MKSKEILFIAVMTFAAIMSFGQKDVSLPVSVVNSSDIFRQGVWNFNLNQIAGLSAGSSRQDGDKTGKLTSYRGNIEANYFIIDNFALGAGIGFSGDKNTYTELDPEALEKTSVIGGHFNALYGNNLGGVVNFIVKGTVGGGKQTSVTDYGFGEIETKYNYINAGISIGTPLQLNRNVYFTPSIGYTYLKYKNDDQKEVRNGFNIGLNMDFFMGCGDDQCQLSKNPLQVSSLYQKGDIELGSKMYGGFKVGGQKITYENDENAEQKDGFSKSRLSGFFRYYVITNLAIGAGLDYTCDRTKSKDTDYKTRDSEITFNPLVRYHLPFNNALRHIYAEGAIGFGANTSKTDDGNNENKDNASVFNWKISAGYNYFVSEHFSLSPTIGYGGQSLNYKDDDYKLSDNGFYAGIGWNYHLR